jgi:outer membrane immunogenic protein
MKKIALTLSALILGTVTASAADMAVKARPAPIAAPIYDWSGCYIGGHAGGTWGRTNVDIPLYPANFNADSSSFSGGALAGCNIMTQSRFVFGIEGDYTWMDLDTTHLTTGLGNTELFHTHHDQSASIRGRIGYSPLTMPNLLLYGTGGYSTANLSQANYIPLAPVADPFRSGWASGWVAGVGVEWAFASNWIAGVEYLHAEYDRQSFVYNGPTSVQLDTDTVRARLSYKFNWWGAPVPY